RVAELGRDRPDLAPQPAEVVEELRALARQLVQHRPQPQDVHVHESTTRSAGAVAASRLPGASSPPGAAPERRRSAWSALAGVRRAGPRAAARRAAPGPARGSGTASAR